MSEKGVLRNRKVQNGRFGDILIHIIGECFSLIDSNGLFELGRAHHLSLLGFDGLGDGDNAQISESGVRGGGGRLERIVNFNYSSC